MWCWNIPGVFVACEPFSNVMSRLKVRPEHGGQGGGGSGEPASERVGPSCAKFASTLAAYLKELFM